MKKEKDRLHLLEKLFQMNEKTRSVQWIPLQPLREGGRQRRRKAKECLHEEGAHVGEFVQGQSASR